MTNTTNHPKPHEKIIKAANNGELVVFLGAGASQLCGSPSWTGFAKNLISELQASAAIQAEEATELMQLGDARRTLSVAKNMAERQKLVVDYDRILHPAEPKPIGLHLYNVLQRLRPVFVTTNYDKWLHKTEELETLDGDAQDALTQNLPAYREAEIFKPEHFTADKLSKAGAIIHLHGSYTDPSSMLISLRDYVRHYSNPLVTRFLSDMFRDFTVLFVGYGLAELEILEQIIRVKGDVSNQDEIRHFILLSTKSNQEKQTEFITAYFKDECGVGVLPYNTDNDNYAEIVSVLENWSSQIEVKEANILELQRRIDKFVAEEQFADRRHSALSLVEQNPKLRPYFIAKLESTIWYDDLERAQYFDAARIIGNSNDGELDTREFGCREILGYVEKIYKSGQPIQAEKILQLIREITNYSKKKHVAHTWHALWSCSRIISTLPVDHLGPTDIAQLETWFDNPNSDFLAMDLGSGLLENLLNSKEVTAPEKAMQLVSLIIDDASKKDSGNYNDGTHLKDAISERMHRFGERCGIAGVALLLAKLVKKIGTPENDKNTYLTRRSIEPHEHDRYAESVVGTLIDSVRDALTGAGTAQNSDIDVQVEELLKSQYLTENRLGIFAVTRFYSSVAKTFWRHCQGAWFSEPSFEAEVHLLLQECFADFDVRAKSKLLAMIVSLPGTWPEDSRVEAWKDEHRRDLIARARAEKDEMFEELFTELVNRVGPPPEELDPVPNNSVVWGGDESPLTSEKILSMQDSELQKFMADFVPTTHHFSGPTFRGFGQALSTAVQLSPDGYKGRLSIFHGSNPAYIDAVFSGLKARLTQDVTIPEWAEIMQIGQLWSAEISEKGFSIEDEESLSLEPVHKWVVGEFAGLIKAGLAGGKNSIPTDLLSPCIELFIKILENLKPTLAKKSEDALRITINSPYGRTLETIIKCLSTIHRRDKDEPNSPDATKEIWSQVKPTFEAAIIKTSNGQNLEFSTLMGLYIPEMRWIDKDWTESNFNRIFSMENNDSWTCAATGFSYQNYQYKWLYECLRREGHLSRMLNSSNVARQTWKRAVQAVGLAYVNKNENIQDEGGILRGLINDVDEDALSHLCWYFWHIQKSENKNDFTPDILEFWQAIDFRMTSNPNPKVSQALNQLSVYIDELDDESEQLWSRTLNNTGAERHSHEHIVLVEIARLVGISPERILGIFNSLIKKNLPIFNENEVKRIVHSLAKSDFINEAKAICIHYNEQGSHILDKIYNEIR